VSSSTSDRPLAAVVAAIAVLAAIAGLVAALASAGTLGSPDARDGGRGSFAVSCAWSHTLADDPIAAPGRPGASHLHAFFGNTATHAGSTRRELLRAATTCSDPQDTAAVWAPVPIVAGEPVTPVRERTYYFGARGETLVDLPPDLRLIAGGPGTQPDGRPIVSWSCGRDTPVADRPYDCGTFRDPASATDGVIARIDFPSCWNGVSLDAADHRSHVVYPTAEGCPGTHPRAIPRISVRIHTGVWDPCAGVRPCGPADPEANLRFGVSSGSYETLHADLWNTWRQRRLDRLTDACLRTGRKCGILRTPGQADGIFGADGD
jgi:hypothetical protein